MINRTLISQKL